MLVQRRLRAARSAGRVTCVEARAALAACLTMTKPGEFLPAKVAVNGVRVTLDRDGPTSVGGKLSLRRQNPPYPFHFLHGIGDLRITRRA